MNNDQQKTLEDLYKGKDEKHIEQPKVEKKSTKSMDQFGNLKYMVFFALFVLVLILVAIFAGFEVFL